ncbi:L-2-hydroxyglutarate oxidase [Sphingobium sp. CECT 9361]|uniref:L-2-hydroxyglutarate oxidase n=1 Tax=Sphingobium sp. CECT 9361 TaxID=2845384 RepID=UPI001E647A75|nr:L-2-hydroxyglutarate oxidase [Sphingobium sp. CECT 9361]CAH0356551.1 L-2-hydroxyglutarate dehydrogenase [Sphingobium sp. CECT 9361]
MSSGSAGNAADVIIVGGGIVGVSAALQLATLRPGISVLLLEKEQTLAAHQSGHNSGVIHAGVYYAPGSLKARFCRAGSDATYAFTAEHGIRSERCGKLIVATDEVEVSRLSTLFERSKANDLDPEMLDGRALNEVEPAISGLAAIRVGRSGITDYPAMTRKMAEIACAQGAAIRFGTKVTGIAESPSQVVVETTAGVFRSRHAIVCGGLMADRLAAMCKLDLDFRIVPFRGEYFQLPAARNDIVKHLIYPVPDPDLPFLGVHLTRMIDGSVTVGPNAILALAREGYRWRDINPLDLAGTLLYPGFWRMLSANLRPTISELESSLSRAAYLRLCQKYCPELELDDLRPYPAGVRAQAVMRDGTLMHDFLIRESARCLHVCNAPSPAATSAIPIGQHLAEQFFAFAAR